MAISTQDPVLVWRRVANYMQSFRPSIAAQLKALKSYLATQGGNPDLQLVPFSALSSTDVVIADAACKIYAVVLNKATATATFTKATDSASASSDTAAEYVIKSAGVGNQHALIFPTGAAMASGVTMQGNTTADGGTGSGADGADGFVLLGAA